MKLIYENNKIVMRERFKVAKSTYLQDFMKLQFRNRLIADTASFKNFIIILQSENLFIEVVTSL